MQSYILSQKSKEDIDAIFDFGFQKFGKEQALNYLNELRSHFELLLKNPEIGKKREEIKKVLYGFPFISHIIFYRILKDQIRIVRVLNGSRDIRKFLE